MQNMALCLMVLVAASGAITGASAEQNGAKTTITPVQKVIQLLEGMLAKGKEEKHQETVAYAGYKQFCDDNIARKVTQIADGESEIESLKAQIDMLGNEIETLTGEIKDLNKELVAREADKTLATKIRTQENDEYKELHKDLSESVFALEHAIETMKKQDKDIKQKEEALLQVSNLKGMPQEGKKVITGFLAQDADLLAEAQAAPEADAYEFQSGGIIDMMEKLLEKFRVEINAVEMKEQNSLQAYQMLVDDLKNQITTATNILGEKTETKTKKMGQKAEAEDDLAKTIAVKKADVKYKVALEAEYQEKTTDYEARQALRAEELQTIQKAIEIITDAKIKGNSEKYLPAGAGSALAQLRSAAASKQEDTKQRAIEYLQTQATSLNSHLLQSAALHANEFPFQKVKKMIKDLIVRLVAEATDEAERKGWCDAELATNLQTRKEMTHGVEVLTSEIEELESIIATMTEKIAKLTQQVADLTKAMADATKLRASEKATNTQTIADAKQAQEATAMALTVLKDFYTKANEATQFVQKSKQPERYQDSPMPFDDNAYKGMQGESNSIVGYLEVIESDFALLEKETIAAEAAAQKKYDEFMVDSETDKGTMEAEIKHLIGKKADDTRSLETKKTDLDETQKQLDAALAYFEKLKPTCINSPVSYEERVERRKAEIKSLQEALKILNNDDI